MINVLDRMEKMLEIMEAADLIEDFKRDETAMEAMRECGLDPDEVIAAFTKHLRQSRGL